MRLEARDAPLFTTSADELGHDFADKTSRGGPNFPRGRFDQTERRSHPDRRSRGGSLRSHAPCVHNTTARRHHPFDVGFVRQTAGNCEHSADVRSFTPTGC